MEKSTNFILAIGFIVLNITIWITGKEIKQDIVSSKVSQPEVVQLKTIPQEPKEIKTAQAVSPAIPTDQIEKLVAQFEAAIISLQKDSNDSINAQNNRLDGLEEQIAQINTELTSNIVVLANEQTKKFKGIETRLQALESKIVANVQDSNAGTTANMQVETMLMSLQKESKDSDSRQNEQIKSLGKQIEQASTTSTNNIIALSIKQDERFKRFKAQLKALGVETALMSLQKEIKVSDNTQNHQLNNVATLANEHN